MRRIGYSDTRRAGYRGAGAISGEAPFSPDQIPDLFSWHRGDLGLTLSDVTFTNANTFSAWTQTGITSVVSGASDPVGGSNAWTVTENTTASVAHNMYDTPTNAQATGYAVMRIYAKAGTGSWIYLQGDVGSSSINQWFDVSNGTLGSSLDGGAWNANQMISASITDAGSGWYLCEMICFLSTSARFYVGFADADGNKTHTGTSRTWLIYTAYMSQQRCTSWADQTGGGRYFSQTTASIQPGWQDEGWSTVLNGQQCLSFDGVSGGDRYLNNGSVPADWNFLHTGVGGTLALVIHPPLTGGSGNDIMFDTTLNGGGAGFYSVRNATAGTGSVGIFASAGANRTVAATFTSTAGAVLRLIFQIQTGTWRMTANGTVTTGTPSAALGSGDAASIAYIGGSSSGTRFHGHVAEILTYDRYLTDQEVIDLDDYLEARYG